MMHICTRWGTFYTCIFLKYKLIILYYLIEGFEIIGIALQHSLIMTKIIGVALQHVQHLTGITLFHILVYLVNEVAKLYRVLLSNIPTSISQP